MLRQAKNLPVDFQNQIISVAQRLVYSDSVRFLVFSPRYNLSQGAYSAPTVEAMEVEYVAHWQDDPMHPSRYEDTEVLAISNSKLMTLPEWKASSIYKNFFAPNGIVHDLDIFFRQDGKIIGVLTMLRSNDEEPFTDSDIDLMEKIQPFMEYSLSKVFLPERITDRQQLMSQYCLTLRELDVLEYALSGLSNKELVRHLGMSLPTLRTHLQNIYLKVGVHSTSELISKVLREVDFN